jgi:flagellar basal body-associated protein FliL
MKLKNKRGSAWIWILIILILIAVGIGVYIWLSGDSSPIANVGTSGGSAITGPPAFPE